MLDKTKKIIKYKTLTQVYPHGPANSGLWAGTPAIDPGKCSQCGECFRRCPSSAISQNAGTKIFGINYDQCVFCMLCLDVCPVGAVTMTTEFELAQKEKQKLRCEYESVPKKTAEDPYEQIGRELKSRISKLFGRSLKIREVDAGSCNGCDNEINALGNPFNDIERFGISFVASPRHADMLMVTGICTRNMKEALLKTYNAAPDPKLVAAVGACACSGGIFRDTYASGNGIDNILPVDVYIPGCPPRPQAILYGILKALDRL